MALNLSCGQCKSIRPFSGTPLTCDVCGWVYTPASRQALPHGVSSAQQAAHPYTPKENSIGDMLGGAAGCFAALLILAFYAGCGLVVVAAIVWAWHYLFG